MSFSIRRTCFVNNYYYSVRNCLAFSHTHTHTHTHTACLHIVLKSVRCLKFFSLDWANPEANLVDRFICDCSLIWHRLVCLYSSQNAIIFATLFRRQPSALHMPVCRLLRASMWFCALEFSSKCVRSLLPVKARGTISQLPSECMTVCAFKNHFKAHLFPISHTQGQLKPGR